MAEVRMYKLHPMFAAEHNLPVAITAVVLVETQKAVYLYGHGSLKVAATCGFCCRCGRTLTHPGSIVLGIGPECLGNWQMRDDVLKSLDADRVAELRRKIKVERKVDCWVPKKCLKDFGISEEDVPIPKEHPRLRRPDQTTSVTESGGLFTVRFPYDPAKVAYIKTVPGRRWDPNNKCWTVPANAISAEMLREVGFTVPQADAQSVEAGRGVGSLEGFGKTLMPFQMEGFKAIYRFGGRVLIGDDMGLGKTIQALAYIYAQKKERPVLVICPTTMKPVWAAEVRSTCPGVSYNLVSGRKREALPKADIHIIGYDVVAARLGDLLGAKFQVLVLDECFPAGTRISTPFGEKEIQTLQTGDLVINAAGVGVIKNIDAHYVPISSIVRLHLSNGEKIRCTSEHPFFTEHGWVSAIDLQGKKVFTHSQICTIMSSNTNGKKGGHYGKSLRVLWQGFSNSQREQPKTKILRDILRSEMEDETACRAQKNAEALGRQGKVIFNNEKNAPRKSACATDLFKKYEREQPNKKTRSHRKNKKTLGAIWAPIIQAADKRREWPPTPCCSTGFVRSIGKWLGTRIPYPHKKKKPFSNQLQSGFSIPRKKNMDRSRWLGTSVTRGENEGQKKRIYPSFIRVERVEVYQPKNNGGTSLSARGSEKVYNLEVSGHPSFFAEGFLVHNCHFLKNRSAQRTKAVLGVGKKATGLSSIPTIIALSGTPFLSRPVEIFPVIKALAPNKIPPFMTFAHQYCGATHNGFGWDFNGCSNAEELFQLLISAVMIRRTKTEVLKDLPDKTRTVIPLEMEKKARQEYKKANQHFLGWLKSVNPDKLTAAMRAEALVQFQELKKLARRGKWAAAMEWLQDTLESCDKVIIFGTHHETVDLLMEALKTRNPVKLDGRSSPKAKEDAVRRFQEDPTCKVFIGNVKAAGVGLTLTAASTVAFMELGWTPGEHNQAEDRAHRIGQKKAVNIYYLLAEDTIEMQIAALLDRKRRVLDAVLDGKETESAALLVELLHKYMQEQR